MTQDELKSLLRYEPETGLFYSVKSTAQKCCRPRICQKGVAMTTTPPPMPEPQGRFNDTYDGWVDSNDFTLEQMQARDAQWMERITALEADRKMLREALTRAERKLSAYIGVCTGDKQLTDAVLPMARKALEQTK